jgi:hypothetical protein
MWCCAVSELQNGIRYHVNNSDRSAHLEPHRFIGRRLDNNTVWNNACNVAAGNGHNIAKINVELFEWPARQD